MRALVLSWVVFVGCERGEEAAQATPEAEAPRFGAWRDLFDGESLGAFRPTGFAHEEEAWVDGGRIHLELGVTLSGVTWTDPFPTDGYEVEVVAARISGDDFFCGVTFPVEDSHCSLILGGWGGSLCGISSLDGFDASENETTRIESFEPGRDYRATIRVDRGRIAVDVDGSRWYDLAYADRGLALSVRSEVLPSRPFGVASFATHAAIRSVRLREVRKP